MSKKKLQFQISWSTQFINHNYTLYFCKTRSQVFSFDKIRVAMTLKNPLICIKGFYWLMAISYKNWRRGRKNGNQYPIKNFRNLKSILQSCVKGPLSKHLVFNIHTCNAPSVNIVSRTFFFSTLRRLKFYLRNSRSKDRLTGLALL